LDRNALLLGFVRPLPFTVVHVVIRAELYERLGEPLFADFDADFDKVR
jgi:hypothetical protein